MQPSELIADIQLGSHIISPIRDLLSLLYPKSYLLPVNRFTP